MGFVLCTCVILFPIIVTFIGTGAALPMGNTVHSMGTVSDFLHDFYLCRSVSITLSSASSGGRRKEMRMCEKYEGFGTMMSL